MLIMWVCSLGRAPACPARRSERAGSQGASLGGRTGQAVGWESGVRTAHPHVLCGSEPRGRPDSWPGLPLPHSELLPHSSAALIEKGHYCVQSTSCVPGRGQCVWLSAQSFSVGCASAPSWDHSSSDPGQLHNLWGPLFKKH